MRRIILMLLATILITGCKANGAPEGAEEGQFDDKASFDSSRALVDKCDPLGGTHVNLFYGNFQIRTAGVVHLKVGKIFAIRLMPENDANNRSGIDYKTETVTISGKDSASGWLSAVGSYDSAPAPHHDLIICVPPGTAKGTYYYQIYITNTGSLDPRVEVTF